jgi:hypothetical protein
MTRSNQVILQELLTDIQHIVAQGSSEKYVAMVLAKYVKQEQKRFPFLSAVHIEEKKITIDSAVNKADPKAVAAFVQKLTGKLFSKLFLLLLQKYLSPQLETDLKSLGVKLA